MKLMVITAGLNPTPGASNSYQEAMMTSLAQRGHDVVCVCMAGVSSRPGIRWRRLAGSPPGYQILNAGVYPAHYPQGGIGTQRPERDEVAGSALRRIVCDLVRAEAPDVISIQSFFGFPFSLIDDLRALGPRLVFTAHDYFPLCPTAHLFTVEDRVCGLSRDQLICDQCCRNAPGYPVFWVNTQLDRWIDRLRRTVLRRWLQRTRNGLRRLDRRWQAWRARPEPYRVRQEAAARALRRLHVVHCISEIQAAEMRRVAGTLENVRVLSLIPPTLRTIKPVPRTPTPGDPTTFVALNVHSTYKGMALLTRVFGRLAETHRGAYALRIHGNIQPGPAIPGVTYHGRYRDSDLDGIAQSADFCLLPSLCSETLGFVGMEMVARGVPLIASARAGVSEFVEHGATGLVFEPEPDAILLDLLAGLIAQPAEALRLRTNLVRGTTRLKVFDEHIVELEALFEGMRQR